MTERPEGLLIVEDATDGKDDNKRSGSTGGMARKPSARGNQRPPVTPSGQFDITSFRVPARTSDERFKQSTQPPGSFSGIRPMPPRTVSSGPLPPPHALVQRENSQGPRSRSGRGGSNNRSRQNTHN